MKTKEEILNNVHVEYVRAYGKERSTIYCHDETIEAMEQCEMQERNKSKSIAIDFAKWVENCGYILILDGIMSSSKMNVIEKGWSRFDEDKIITDDELWQEYQKRNQERAGLLAAAP